MRGRKPNPAPAAETFSNSTGTGADITLIEPAWVLEAPPEWQRAAAALACEKWAEITAGMRAMGTLSPENALAIEVACVQYARWRLAEAQVAKLGPMLRAPVTGVPMQNPFLSVANAACDRFIKLAAELGLTPAMRGRVTKIGAKRAKNAGQALAL